MPPAHSKPEASLALQLRGLAPVTGWRYVPQYRWHPTRRFRADFAVWGGEVEMGSRPLLVEIDGASRFKPLGAHQRAQGIDRDCRRGAEAAALGYRVLRLSAPMVYDGDAIQYIQRLLTPSAQPETP